MTESERLLHLFVHDLRAPLGVATGYLRLIQDGRMSSDEDRRLAFSRTLDALGKIAHLCDVVGEVGAAPEPTGHLRPDELIGRVEGALAGAGAITRANDWTPDAAVVIGRDGDRFARAIAVVIGAVRRRASPATVVHAGPHGSALRFALGSSTSAEPTNGDRAFDPWRGFGLEVVLACQAIEATGGRVLAGGDADVAVDLPLVRSEAH